MLKAMLMQAMQLDGGQKWPTYDGKELDRSEFLTSSEVASCLRKAYFAKLAKTGGLTNGYAERGHAVEAWFVGKIRALEQLGYRFEYIGSEQRSFYDPDIGVSGTPDGVVTLPDGRVFLLEIKSIDPRTNKNNLPKRNHIFQTQQNMYLVNKCLGRKLPGAWLIYIDASDVFDIREFYIAYNDQIVDECLSRADTLWSANEADDLEAEGLYTGDCDRCNFTGECSATIKVQKALATAGAAAAPFLENGLPLEGETLFTEEEEDAIDNFLYAYRERKEFEAVEEDYKDIVKKIVTDRNGLVLRGEQILTATVNPGRATPDKEALLAAGVDLDQYMKTGKPFVTLNVKQVKGART